MIEAYIRKIEEHGDTLTIEITVDRPDKPICPDQQDYFEKEQFVNADAEYHKAFNKYLVEAKEIDKLHIGFIEFKQDE